jgi:hypothetical protein
MHQKLELVARRCKRPYFLCLARNGCLLPFTLINPGTAACVVCTAPPPLETQLFLLNPQSSKRSARVHVYNGNVLRHVWFTHSLRMAGFLCIGDLGMILSYFGMIGSYPVGAFIFICVIAHVVWNAIMSILLHTLNT